MTECTYCGSTAHKDLQCPRIKAIEFSDEDSTRVLHVEFHAPGDELVRIREGVEAMKDSLLGLALTIDNYMLHWRNR
jgi:hypothetical protein